jgi:hypothetical protein
MALHKEAGAQKLECMNKLNERPPVTEKEIGCSDKENVYLIGHAYERYAYMKSRTDRKPKSTTLLHYVTRAGIAPLRLSTLDGVSIRPFPAPNTVDFHTLLVDVRR